MNSQPPPAVFPTDDVIQTVGDEATEVVAKPSVLVAKVPRVPADATVDLMDPSAISSPQVEVAVEETPVPEIDAGTPSIHTNLPAAVFEEIVGESPSHDSQHVMEGEAETEEVLLISPIRNLVSEDPVLLKLFHLKVFPSLFLFFLFPLFQY